MRILHLFFCIFSVGSCAVHSIKEHVISNVTRGLCAIVKASEPPQLVILTKNCQHSKRFISFETFCHSSKDFTDFVKLINENAIPNIIFTDEYEYFNYIEENVLGSIKIVSIIFRKPYKLSRILFEQKLAHRVSLFMFYYGEIGVPKGSILLQEPLRLAIITRRFPDV